MKKAECVICGEQYGVYNMSVHEGLKFVEAKAATKTAEGNVEYWYCEDCGKYYIEQNGFVEVTKEQTVVAKLTDKSRIVIPMIRKILHLLPETQITTNRPDPTVMIQRLHRQRIQKRQIRQKLQRRNLQRQQMIIVCWYGLFSLQWEEPLQE